MAELADARDLKSREIYFSYRFDPGFRHHNIAGWSSLAARRAHNPKVVRFKSHSRNQKRKHTLVVCFSFCSRRGLPLCDLRVMRTASVARWVTSKKQLRTVFVTEVHKARSSRRTLCPTMSAYATGRGYVRARLSSLCF